MIRSVMDLASGELFKNRRGVDRMNMIDSVNICFKKSFTFKGRASRSDFWYFALFAAIAMALLELSKSSENAIMIFGFQLLNLFISVPYVSVTMRRSHDLNISGWFVLFYILIFSGVYGSIFALDLLDISADLQGLLVPFQLIVIFAIYISGLYFLARKGTPGDNSYGPDPVGISADVRNNEF